MAKLIYVIDDEKEICELIRISFETRDYDVKIGFDGETALKMVEEKKPDLLILDLKMPKMNGYEVINRLKSTEKFADIPIVVLTSLTKGSTKTDEAWKQSLEVEDFITKPLEPLDILQRVKKILEPNA